MRTRRHYGHSSSCTCFACVVKRGPRAARFTRRPEGDFGDNPGDDEIREFNAMQKRYGWKPATEGRE